MKTDFENKIIELGFSYHYYTDDFYILSMNNEGNSIINAQLICSEPVDESKLGSRNGNVIQSIAHFKLRLSAEVKDPNFLILAFRNSYSSQVEYIILPNSKLTRRLNNIENRISTDNQEIEMVFWLMPDNHLYETTDISVEAEWFYMSKGAHGRMADQTEWDYTEFLNDWDRFKKV